MLRIFRCHHQARGLFLTTPCCSSGQQQQQDHYAVLGVKSGATRQEIKAAYYKLTKKHHPDANIGNQEEAAKKFHQVATAYETLGSEEKRKLYDMTRIRTSPMPGSGEHISNRFRRRPAAPTRQYTDIDIDYKDFEHFQRSTRRRPQYHSHFDMPNEFYSEFGGFKKRVFKSEYEKAQEQQSMYKDSRAAQREMEELRRQVAKEQAEQQARYPIPTFEQMMREKRAQEAKEQQQYLAGMFFAAAIAGILTVLLTR